MMLSEVSFSNFKSYGKRQTLALSPLTVLIGANASGKSNAIEAIRFLSWLAQGQSLSSIQYQVNSADRVVRGIVKDLPHGGAGGFHLGCRLEGTPWNHLELELELRTDGFHISREKVTSISERVPLYELDQPSSERGTEVGVAYNNFARGGIKPHIRASDQHAIFTQLTSAATLNSGHQKSREVIPTVAQGYEDTLSQAIFLDPVPARMREYSFPSESRLYGDGSNLSAVLFNLCDPAGLYPTNKSEVLNFIKSLPEQRIVDLDFLEEPRGGKMVRLIESFGGEDRPCDASLLSDGTLRVLAIAAAMLSADPGSLVVVEEIDNGVHPSRARSLLERILSIAEQRNLRVLLSTHNPALLDALPISVLPKVVFCYRDPRDGDSRLTTLENLETYPELVAQGPLGSLVSSGAVDAAAKRRDSPDSRRKAARAWLDRAMSGVEK